MFSFVPAPPTLLWHRWGTNSHYLISWVRVKISSMVGPIATRKGEARLTALFLQGGLKLPSHWAQMKQVLSVPGPPHPSSLGLLGCWVKGMLSSVLEPTNSTLVGEIRAPPVSSGHRMEEQLPAQSCQHHPVGGKEHRPIWVEQGLQWNINFLTSRGWGGRGTSFIFLFG